MVILLLAAVSAPLSTAYAGGVLTSVEVRRPMERRVVAAAPIRPSLSGLLNAFSWDDEDLEDERSVKPLGGLAHGEKADAHPKREAMAIEGRERTMISVR